MIRQILLSVMFCNFAPGNFPFVVINKGPICTSRLVINNTNNTPRVVALRIKDRKDKLGFSWEKIQSLSHTHFF